MSRTLVLPTTGQIVGGDYQLAIRSGGPRGRDGYFGFTRHDRKGRPKMHRGIDLLADFGTPVYAAHSGVVIRAGWENKENHGQGYGLRCWIHDRNMRTVYAHLSDLLVAPMEEIKRGALIGHVGRTGNVDWPNPSPEIPTHLHFELWHDGAAVNPVPVLIGQEDLA